MRAIGGDKKMIWPFKKPEHRAAYSDAITAALVSQAAGPPSASVQQTGALESCCGLVGRAFMVAEVEASERIKDALTPVIMATIGRSLIRTGELVLFIDVDDAGVIRLLPCTEVEVSGGASEDSWRYTAILPTPGRRKKIRVGSDEIVHFRYSSDPARPWRGQGPLQVAALAGRLGAELSKALADEAGAPVGTLLPIPTDGDDETVNKLRVDIKKVAGQALLVQGGNWGVDGAQATSWETQRLGADPPASLVQLAEFATSEVFSAIGISPSLFAPAGGGGSAREAYRLFLHTVLTPLSRIVAFELSKKLGPVSLGFSGLAASDITAKARAYKQLKDGGMEAPQAEKIVGFN